MLLIGAPTQCKGGNNNNIRLAENFTFSQLGVASVSPSRLGPSLIPMAGPPLIPKDVQLVATRADTEGLPARRRTHLAQSWCESSLAFSLVEPQYASPNANVGAQSC